MHGLAQGEQSDSSNPLLQLISRSGQFLADINSGTYAIEDISDPDVPPVAIGSPTAFNTDLVADGGHKLGLGRYYIPTGNTSSWAQGTHRVVCTYKLTATGKTYTQIIEFEILDAVDFPSGAEYLGYVSTRKLKKDGVTGDLSPSQVHPRILAVSMNLQAQLGRVFDPTPLVLVLNGSRTPLLYLDEAIIAVEKVETVSLDTSGNETRYEWNTSTYKVYNRHLDGMIAPDDRVNPKLQLVNTDGDEIAWNEWQWPYGQCNVEITGVFGYTDPMFDPAMGGVSIGRTPRDLERVIAALITRELEDAALTDVSVHQPGRVKSEKTRHQSISYFGSGQQSGSTYDSITGDPLLDHLLVRMARPINLGYAQRRYIGGYVSKVY
jgi:hypothetical protein